MVPGNSAFIASRPAASIPITTTQRAPEGTGAGVHPPEVVNVAPAQAVSSQTEPATVPFAAMEVGMALPRPVPEEVGGGETVPALGPPVATPPSDAPPSA